MEGILKQTLSIVISGVCAESLGGLTASSAYAASFHAPAPHMAAPHVTSHMTAPHVNAGVHGGGIHGAGAVHPGGVGARTFGGAEHPGLNGGHGFPDRSFAGRGRSPERNFDQHEGMNNIRHDDLARHDGWHNPADRNFDHHDRIGDRDLGHNDLARHDGNTPMGGQDHLAKFDDHRHDRWHSPGRENMADHSAGIHNQPLANANSANKQPPFAPQIGGHDQSVPPAKIEPTVHPGGGSYFKVGQ